MQRSMSILWQTSFQPFSTWNPKYTGGFPKHKELMTDDYYEGDPDAAPSEDPWGSGNPYGTNEKDYEDW